MEEVWKDIKGYEGLYQVSNLGCIKSLSRPTNITEEKNILVRKMISDGFSESKICQFVNLHSFDIYRIKKNIAPSFTKEKFLKFDIKKSTGHLRVTLCKNGKTKRYSVHRLVLETFIGLCPLGMECRHLDNNPRNNRLDNLKWDTHYNNIQDKYKFGTMINYKCIPINTCKLNKEKIISIRIDIEEGVLLQKDIAKKYGVSDSQISEIKNGNQWSHIK